MSWGERQEGEDWGSGRGVFTQAYLTHILDVGLERKVFLVS